MNLGVCCSSVNTGLFSAMKEMGDMRSVHCGHDHDNDYYGGIGRLAFYDN